jgi:DNA-binding transcriptional LysR family regulator
MIALAADALAAMRDLQNVKTGQMAVAASQTTGVYLMPPLIGTMLACEGVLFLPAFTCIHRRAVRHPEHSVFVHAERFKQTHREVTVQLQVENTARCCAMVSRGEVDVAVVGGQIPADLEHLLQVGRHDMGSLRRHLERHMGSQHAGQADAGTL